MLFEVVFSDHYVWLVPINSLEKDIKISNKSLLNSVQSQVKAAEIANEGITAEYNSGAGRTTLEVIQSNTFLLNAQISLADSERNYILSQFNLLKSLGLLNSDYLKIR